MQILDILRDGEQSDIVSKILFERPISRLHARKIGLLAGRHVRLKTISDVHQIITTLNHDAILVAESALKQHIFSADIFLESGKNQSFGFTNTDQAFEMLSECGYVVAGMDLEISAQFQLFIEKLVKFRTAPIIFTNESIDISKTSANIFSGRSDDIYVCDMRHLTTLAKHIGVNSAMPKDAGVAQKLSLIAEISTALNALVVCVEPQQLLAISHHEPARAVISNYSDHTSSRVDLLLTALLASLLSDTPNPSSDILERVVTASWLLRSIIAPNTKLPDSLRKALGA